MQTRRALVGVPQNPHGLPPGGLPGRRGQRRLQSGTVFNFIITFAQVTSFYQTMNAYGVEVYRESDMDGELKEVSLSFGDDSSIQEAVEAHIAAESISLVTAVLQAAFSRRRLEIRQASGRRLLSFREALMGQISVLAPQNGGLLALTAGFGVTEVSVEEDVQLRSDTTEVDEPTVACAHKKCFGEEACANTPTQVFSATVRCESCMGKGACAGSTADIGSAGDCENCGSCLGLEACRQSTGTVARKSCIGDMSCEGLTGTVGAGSCLVASACANNTMNIGDGSCQKGPCITDGPFHGSFNIGDNSCNRHQGCYNCYGDIGDNMCNNWEGTDCDVCPLETEQLSSQPPSSQPNSLPSRFFVGCMICVLLLSWSKW